jgi:hypothetical protein
LPFLVSAISFTSIESQPSLGYDWLGCPRDPLTVRPSR